MVQMITDEPFEKPRALRIRFCKVGALSYISHLDLMRTMTRVMKRAHLPIRYTGGYNPKPHLVFSAPLPVGAESPREFVDIEVLCPVDTEEVMRRLNDGLPAELAVDAVYYPETKFSDIAAAEYRLVIFANNASPALAEALSSRLSDRPLTVRKRTKSGEKDIDVSAAILSVQGEYDANANAVLLTVRLAADSGSFLNPDYLIGYLRDKEGVLLPESGDSYAVVREHLYLANGEDFA
jgi:radical SAM-linked protein